MAHDYELWPIRLAVNAFPQKRGVLALSPQCGVAWNKRAVSGKKLGEIDQILRTFKDQIRESDALQWRDKFMEVGS